MSTEPSYKTNGTSICGFYYSNLVNELLGDNACDLNAFSEAYNLSPPQLPPPKKNYCPQVILSYLNLRS